MPTKPSTNCDIDRLRLLLADQLPEQLNSELADHVEECSNCRQILESFAGDTGWWSEVELCLQSHAEDVVKSGTGSSLLSEFSGSNEAFTSDFVVEFLEPSDQPDALGRLGKYEILEIIGHGGMGVVLKGFQPELGRFVAVKVMAPHLASSGAARQRFVREARAAAAIVHPHVMPIHSVYTSSRLPYLVMPFVNCESLQDRIDQQGRLEVAEILRISLQTAKGLDASHAQGLVHRDVKPANILLEKGVDRVMLTDFGLARAVDDASLTRTGVVSGTPQYMSPEQSRGDSIDARSDLFSLGSVIYAMCAGRPPFRAETALAVLRRICDSEARPIREINPNIPGWLEQIVVRLHDKTPDRRFQSAAELVNLLEQCLAHVQQPVVSQLPEMLKRAAESTDSSSKSSLVNPAGSTRIRRMMGCCVLMVAFAFLIVRSQINNPQENSPRLLLNRDQSPTLNEPSQTNLSIAQFISPHSSSNTDIAGNAVCAEDCTKFFSPLDSNSDGELTEDEYAAAGPMPADRLRRDFKIFDVDNNGLLTLVEFQSIPYLVPEDLRTGLPDPIALLSEAAMSEFSKSWNRWDSNGDGLLSRREFSKANPGRQIRGLEKTQFENWDLNSDAYVSREEAGRSLDIAYGVRNPNGELIRSTTGCVVDWRLFRKLKTDANGKVRRNIYYEALGPLDIGEKQKRFDAIDHDQDGLISYAEFSTSPHRTHPVNAFLDLDVDLNGRLNPAELDGLPGDRFPDVKYLFPGFDDDRDGTLSLREFQLTPVINLLASWHAAQDIDSDGFLSPEEFQPGAGLPLAALSAEYFRKLDLNQDQLLSLDEFPFQTHHVSGN